MNSSPLLPAFIAIPATPFAMGTPDHERSALAKAYGGTRESYREESPQHMRTLPAFAIARTPVTNALYAAYLAATNAPAPAHWHDERFPATQHDHPVVGISWIDATNFCQWLTASVQHPEARIGWRARLGARLAVRYAHAPRFRLPSEAEWEHAARGSDGRRFPWGDTWNAALANTQEAGRFTTTPVEAYPGGASPYGCLDMCGNVWEWTASLDRPYPYAPNDGRERPRAEGRRILRGGCYANPHGFARCACRFRLAPATRNEFLGFRLVRVLATEP